MHGKYVIVDFFCSHTEEGVDFQVVDKTLNFVQTFSPDGKYEIHVTVNLTDTGVSGRRKTFVLCLNVSNDTATNEQRAELADPSCITVQIKNTYCKLCVYNYKLISCSGASAHYVVHHRFESHLKQLIFFYLIE